MNLDDRKVDLIEEGFDLAVRISDLPDSSLVARRLASCRHVVCAAPEYLQRHGIPQTPDDLHEHNTLTYHITSFKTSGAFSPLKESIFQRLSPGLFK